MAQASQQEMNQFVQVVDEFMSNYKRLTSPKTRADVYATRNPALISDYESAVSKGGMLKSTIEGTVGAWNAAKRAYSSVTDTTSQYIGDAVDWVKNLFGAGPQPLNGLGAVQIPAAVWVAGIVASALLLNSLMTKIFVSLEASRIQRDSPGISREQAISIATSTVGKGMFEGIQTPVLVAGAAFIAWLYFGKK